MLGKVLSPEIFYHHEQDLLSCKTENLIIHHLNFTLDEQQELLETDNKATKLATIYEKICHEIQMRKKS